MYKVASGYTKAILQIILSVNSYHNMEIVLACLKYILYQFSYWIGSYVYYSISIGLSFLKYLLFLYDVCCRSIDSDVLTSRLVQICLPNKRTRHTVIFYTHYNQTRYAAKSIMYRLKITYDKKIIGVDPLCVGKIDSVI